MTIDVACLDRTLKGIGVVDAAPVYESLPGLERYVTLYGDGQRDEDIQIYVVKTY